MKSEDAAWRYRGTWSNDPTAKPHRVNDLATRESSLWILANADKGGRPGDAGSGWILVAKGTTATGGTKS